MDKYEYKLKTEQMLELMEEGAWNKAAEIADGIDWKRVRNTTMLMNVSDIYEKSRDYQKSYEVLNIAYHRAEGSRKILYRLCTLALKTRNVDEAIDYYDEFVQLAPKDPNQYILRYQILRAQRAPIEQQIEALELFKRAEYIEEWAYELAKLYQEAGMTAECLEECDDLILWFSEGKYVYQAMELKMKYKPLTPSQQEKYDRRYEKPSTETEEMPDLTAYAKKNTQETMETEAMPTVEELKEVQKPSENTAPAERAAAEARVPENKAEEADEEIEMPEEVKEPPKRKLGNTMKLDEALRALLHLDGGKPEEEAEEEAFTGEEPAEEEDLSGLEDAMKDIASVVDLNLVKEVEEEKKKEKASHRIKVDPDLEELIAEPLEEEEEPELTAEADIVEEAEPEMPDTAENEGFAEADAEEYTEEPEWDAEAEGDQVAGQMSLEDLLAGDWTSGETDREEEAETEADTGSEADMQEDNEGEADSDAEADMDAETETDTGAIQTEQAGEETAELDMEEAEPLEETAELDMEEAEPLGETAELDMEEAKPLEEIAAESEKEGAMEEKKKTGEPILPPDIQRLIDEIEGVIPMSEEEPEEETVVSGGMEERAPKDNMGAAAEDLRLDMDSDEFDIFDDELDEDEYEDDLPEEIIEEEEIDWGDGEVLEEEDSEDYEAYEEEDSEDYEAYEEDAEEYEEYDEYEEEDSEDYEAYEEDAEAYEEYEEYGEEDSEDYEDYEEDAEAYEEYDEYEEEDSEEYDYGDYEEEEELEVPDEEEVSLLTSTAPLSRKETAKLIATGKTAPLPVDEISDALSISDTGFLVHSRYEMPPQDGRKRAGLTEEQKRLFSYFVPVRGMSEQLVDVLEQDKNCTNRRGTSATGNLLIIGNKGNGKTVLAVDVVKAIQKQRSIRQGKVAIVTGESLNKKKISDIISKLYGGALIIEKAGRMNEKTVARLNKAMEQDTGELLIVLEDQRKPLDRLLSSNREFRRKFTSRLEVPIFINDELVTFGQTYAQENGYRIDEMGLLALYSRIDALQREDHSVTIAEVKEVMDEAMAHSQKASAKKLVKRVFGKNTDDADRIILTEKDFNI